MKKENVRPPVEMESPQLSLLDEIAFDMIVKAGRFSDKEKSSDTHAEVKTYPRILEDL